MIDQIGYGKVYTAELMTVSYSTTDNVEVTLLFDEEHISLRSFDFTPFTKSAVDPKPLMRYHAEYNRDDMIAIINIFLKAFEEHNSELKPEPVKTQKAPAYLKLTNPGRKW